MADTLSEAIRKARSRLARRRRDRPFDYDSHDEHAYETDKVANERPPYSPALLSDMRLNKATNASVRAEVLHGAQQTHGNRAVQRFLQVQRSANTYDDDVGDDELGKQIGSKAQDGEDLDETVRSSLEKDLKANLTDVQVHTDAEADHMARSVKAPAFTSGRHIFFQAGAYDPTSNGGMKLLAHEAMHVVQQSKGPVDGKPTDSGVTLSDPGDTFEQEAEQAADDVEAKRNQGDSAPADPEPIQRSEVEEAQPTVFSASTLYVQRG